MALSIVRARGNQPDGITGQTHQQLRKPLGSNYLIIKALRALSRVALISALTVLLIMLPLPVPVAGQELPPADPQVIQAVEQVLSSLGKAGFVAANLDRLEHFDAPAFNVGRETNLVMFSSLEGSARFAYIATGGRLPEDIAQFRQLLAIKNSREWRELMMSLENRLGRFLASTGIRRFIGLPHGLDLMDVMDSRKILLVNLGASDALPRDAARVFGSLLINQIFEGAMRRANRSRLTGQAPETCVVYLDEFQQLLSPDIAEMLDQIRKGGVHLVLAHQHMQQLDEAWLKESVLTNARLRFVFGGQSYPSACELGNEMFLPDLNTRKIKKAYYHTIHLYREETRIVRSHTRGRGNSSGTSWSRGKSTGSNTSSSRSHSEFTSQGLTTAVSSGQGTGCGPPRTMAELSTAKLLK